MAKHLRTRPRRHRVLAILAALLLGICILFVSLTPSSAYDLTGILSLPPQLIPAELTRLGFHYELGVPSGSWQLEPKTLEGQPAGSTCRVSFSGVKLDEAGRASGYEYTVDSMLDGQRPPFMTLAFDYAPHISADEALEVASGMLDRAGLGKPESTTRTDSPEWGRVTITLRGSCRVGGKDGTWKLSVGIDDGLDATDYLLTVSTE